MTTGSGAPPVATVQPAAELFTRSAAALWATTYSVDLALFSEFLLPRLGDPPLNVVVLADHERLATSLARIPPEREDTLATVNRRWLLRGISAGGVFHPKSYLSVTGRRATLLVGSGNLSVGGLDEGREVFTTFRSGTPVGDSAIAIWKEWARRLVEMAGDTALAERFRDLQDRPQISTAERASEPAPLLHNLDVAVADQLAATVGSIGEQVEELLLAAPFYDAEAAAVGVLLDMFRPRRVRLFVTGTTSVNGEHLARRLTESGAQVTVLAYEPDQFVHAKFIGIVTRSRAWALSGSANLSRAALTLTPSAHGNIELAVLTPMDTDELRAVFVPPDTGLTPASMDRLACLDFRGDPQQEQSPVRLFAAIALRDGRVEIRCDPAPAPDWLLDDASARQPIMTVEAGGYVTAAPLGGRLVQLVDAAGCVLSNRCVVDDPIALDATLTGGPARPDADRPPELGEGDLESPLGQALTWLHQNLVMDVSERANAAGTGGIVADEAEGQTDEDSLWDRLEREQLACDPRAATYARLWQPGFSDTQPLIELLEMLRTRLPAGPDAARQSLLSILLDQPPSDGQTDGRRWSTSARIRVRARNLLRRWAAAQTDPRLRWIDPLAPAGNFTMMAETLVTLRLASVLSPGQVELTGDDLDDIWQRWLRGFAGAGEGDGWLDQLDDDTASLIRDRLPGRLPEEVAALTWLVIRPGIRYRERVIAFQPVLTASLGHGLIDPTEESARYLTAVTGTGITRDQVDDDLLAAAVFIDDDLWCIRTSETLALPRLRLRPSPGAAAVGVRLDVLGVSDPLLDPRIPRVVTAARNYRGCDGVAVYASDASWRVVTVTGETVYYLPRPGAATVKSAEPLASGTIESLAAAGGVLADLFPGD